MLRERRALSTREVGKLSEIDHAYIHRLESGEKSSPSAEVIQKLIAVFRTNARDSAIVNWLVDHPGADPWLVEYALATQDVSIDEFTMAAGARFRGTGRPDPATLIARMRRALSDMGDE